MSEKIREFDEKGNLIHCKYSDGLEIWAKYNENNSPISYKDNKGYRYRHEYDEKNREIHWKNNRGRENFYKYNEDGRQVEFTKKEFEQIEKEKEYRRYIKRKYIDNDSRFEIMDI